MTDPGGTGPASGALRSRDGVERPPYPAWPPASTAWSAAVPSRRARDRAVMLTSRAASVAVTSSHRGRPVGRQEPLRLPVAQGRQADAEGTGELGDAHRVSGSRALHRLRGDRPDRVLRQRQLPALGVQSRVCRVEEGQQVRHRTPVRCAQEPLGLHRADSGRQGPVGQHRDHVRLGVDPVARRGPRRRLQDALALEVPDLLDRVTGLPGDVDRPQARLGTSHAVLSLGTPEVSTSR
jgi:hypothetical protein